MKKSNLTTINDFDTKNISILSNLKPAATKLILDCESASIIELLKLTLFDLSLKQVLIIKKELKKLNPSDRHLREYIIIETGKNFRKYNASRFELLFLERIKEDTYYHLRVYIKEIYRDITSKYRYKKDILNDSNINTLFKNSTLSNIFKIINLNTKGNTIKKNIKTHFDNIDHAIVDLLNSDPQKALDIILFLKGNIFLLKNLKFDLWNKINDVYKTKMQSDDDFYDDWFLSDLSFDSDYSITELFLDDSNFLNTFDDSFGYEDDSYWDGGDFDFD